MTVGNFGPGPSATTVAGTVAVSNFPATQPVSGTVTANQGTNPWTVGGTVAVSNFPATQPVSGSVTVSNFPATQAVTGADTAADGHSNPTTSVLVDAYNSVFNGTTWDRIRSAISDAMGSTGLLAAAGMVFNGTTWDRLRSGTATGSILVNNPTPGNLQVTTTPAGGVSAVNGAMTPGDGVANPTDAVDTRDFLEVFNGTTWDRMRSGTAQGSVLVNNPVAANFQATVTGTVALGGSTTSTTSLNAQSSVQNGTVLDDGAMRTHHTIVLTTSSGVSGGTVIFQVSQDNTNWFNAVTFSTTTPSVVASADVTGAFRYSRVAITVAITGGTVTATIAST